MKRYATNTGQSYDRLTKMLRGDVLMRFEDVAAARLYFGLELQIQLPSSMNSPDHEQLPSH